MIMKKRLTALLLTAVFMCSLTGCVFFKAQSNALTAEDAERLACEHFGFELADCTFNRTELDEGEYEVEFIHDGKEYEVHVMIATGTVTEIDIDNGYKYSDGNTSDTVGDTSAVLNTMTEDEAKGIAFAHLGLNAEDCTVTRIEFDDGKYEIEFVCNGKEYDVEVHSKTGAVTELDVDRLEGILD